MRVLPLIFCPLILAGCASTDVVKQSGGYYQESGPDTSVQFESVDEIFSQEESVPAPSIGSVNDSVEGILFSGYSKNEIENLTQQGVDLSILEKSIVHFPYDSYKLDANTLMLVDEHAKLLTEMPDLKVILEGHTDNRGDRAYNLKLGENRAIAVRDYLVSKHGITPERVEIISFGKERLISNGRTSDDHKLNRRAEFKYK